MASGLYDTGRNFFAIGEIDWVDHEVVCLLIDTASYTSNATHSVYSHCSAGMVASMTMAGKAATAGVCSANNVTFTSVTGAPCEMLVLYDNDHASDALICHIEGFTVSPNSGNIEVSWQTDDPKIFKL